MQETMEIMKKLKENDEQYSALLLRILLMIDENTNIKNENSR